jgi:hypothetical protein
MKFEWDENKNRKNQEKHGLDFNDAPKVFEDPDLYVQEDDRNDYGEKRWIAVGSIMDIVFSVAHTIRGMAKRIISFRRAGKNEREAYFNNKNNGKN